MKPSIGRIVHFVQNGVHYPAIITKVWTDRDVNLLVFPNGSDTITAGALDKNDCAKSVPYNDAGSCVSCGHVMDEWSWHWPEKVTE